MAIITLLAIRATFGLDWFINIYEVSLHKVLHWFDVHNIELPAKHMEKINNVEELGSEIMMTLYYVMYMTAVIKTSLLKRPHGWSRELFGGVRNRHFDVHVRFASSLSNTARVCGAVLRLTD